MTAKMINQLSFTEKLAATASSCVIAALAFLACLNLTIAPSYTDFIVGNIAWQADTKLQDIIAAPVFITVLFFGFLFLSLQIAKQKQQFGNEYSAKLSNQLIWWSVPSFAAISSLILGATIDEKIFFISVAGIAFISINSAYNAARKININPDLIGLSLFAIILAGLIPLEIALILGRAPKSLVGDIKLDTYETATYIIIGFGIVFGLIYAMRFPEKSSRFLPKFILIGQVGLPTLFLTLYPAKLLQANGVVTKYQTTLGLKLFIVGMVVWGIFDVVRRHQKYARTAHVSWSPLLSPVALFALLVALKVGNTVAPFIKSDDYHFGEQVLGWWSYLQGAIPYVGYIPAHGVIPDDLSAFLSFVFYDGTAGSFVDAGRLSYALLAFAGFISIYRFSSSIGLAFILIFFVGSYLSWLFFTPFLCLWFSRSLRVNPARWLSIWLLTAPIAILGVPGQGLLLVAASGVMAAYIMWCFWRNSEKREWRYIGISFFVLMVAALTTPLVPMLLGAIRYVLENGAINQVAYGISWAASWNEGAKAGFVFEAIRMSWVAIPVACLGIIYMCMKDQVDRKNTLVPAIVVFLFIFLLIPYSMGRIDPGGVSRPGIAAIFSWAILLPITVWSQLKPANKVSLLLLVASMSATLNFTSLSFSNLVSAASAQIHTGPLRDGARVGLPNIGKATVQDEHWDRLTKLNELLKNKLAPNESYLDLTSRNAQYFYLNRIPMMAITAPYNLVSPSQQKRAIEQLSRNVPRLALLEGSNIIHDGGGLALRNPYLYRFILDNYTPSLEAGFIIGYHKMEEGNNHVPTIEVAVKNLTDVNWDQGIHRTEPAFIAGDAALMPLLTIGTKVRIGTGGIRKITRVWIEGNAIWLDGLPFNPMVVNYPNKIQITVSPQIEAEHRLSLFEKALAQSDFKKIPVAWGRSQRSLAKKMTLINGFEGLSPVLHDLVSENGNYKVTGIDPLLSFDISGFNISGHDAGLLKFDFSCMNRSAEPRIQVYWWGDGHDGPFEAASIRLTADDGLLIVPLDASPRWLTMKHIKGIRIDLDNPLACSAFSVRNINLFQRHQQ
ncbi:MAG: hypothetical protein H7252_07185 [Cytophaga sp.]|nr:hypothetical protein [Undibacterium sp.]